ncbi:MAG TPA: phenylalanine--tRNA ligase subunit beta [Micromonosporaceae bacterium]|jgi:phenylalanyl-tRNA synthetase beta chain|nr:phenylalanine--tRNA ligase subunit beta [Micromonosporaceae bacterium]
MLVPVSWLAEYVSLPDGVTTEHLDEAFVRMAFEVDGVTDLRAAVTGPLVVGRVVEFEQLAKLKKPIRYCQVDVGDERPRGIICGATNFESGDLVVVALPGTMLPGGFEITARKTYGHISDGMICSERELGLGDDHAGILVLPPDVVAKPGEDARPTAGLDEIVFDLNINPDRGYALSVRGLARDLALAFDVPFRDPADVKISPRTERPAYPVRVEDTFGCDRFTARAVYGIDPAASSPSWMKRRLIHAGMRPISLAVDITNYLMVELGQPMHAFDLRRLSGELVVRRAQPSERLTTLDGVERVLDPEDLVISDDTGPISLAAVMGGLSTEVNVATTDVLFEAAHWDPATVARTSRRHKLSSEAGRRWERGVDAALPLVAQERAVRLLTEYAGGRAGNDVLDIDHLPAPPSIRIEPGLAVRVAGLSQLVGSRGEVPAYQAVGCTVTENGDDLVVTPPTWRPDLTDSYDLVEEFVRLFGFANVPSELPPAPPGRGLSASQRRRRSISRSLAEAGYVEVLSYPFVSPSVHDQLRLPADDPRRVACRLANPLSEQEPELRTTLLGPLLATLRRNVGRGHRDLALFEIGLVFRPEGVATGAPPNLPVTDRPDDEHLTAAQRYLPHQPWRVAVVLAGDVELPGWWGQGRVATWADAVQAARIVADTAKADLTVIADPHAPWHPGRCAALRLPDRLGGTLVGHAGELHPAVCDAMDLPRRTCAMELELDRLPLPRLATAPRVSGYPPALLDVALLVDDWVPAAEVQQALAEGAGGLLESIRLFDLYTGERVAQGRKSLAYKLVFRAADRTLTVDEAVIARDAAVAEAARRVGAELRGG